VAERLYPTFGDHLSLRDLNMRFYHGYGCFLIVVLLAGSGCEWTPEETVAVAAGDAVLEDRGPRSPYPRVRAVLPEVALTDGVQVQFTVERLPRHVYSLGLMPVVSGAPVRTQADWDDFWNAVDQAGVTVLASVVGQDEGKVVSKTIERPLARGWFLDGRADSFWFRLDEFAALPLAGQGEVRLSISIREPTTGSDMALRPLFQGGGYRK